VVYHPVLDDKDTDGSLGLFYHEFE
jgi:hypothetical protein